MKTFIVDSFTDQPFKGNPAGVCLPEKALSESLMLNIAKELGLSETAFVTSKGGSFNIRYFSPKMEIPLCGHATLAAAKILFDQQDLSQINFTTVQNILLNIQAHEDKILMEFPVYHTQQATPPHALLKALNIEAYVNCAFSPDTDILLLELDDDQLLTELTPDYEALYQSHQGIAGLIVTAKSTDSRYDFKSRYFWPWTGTNEDPVTGLIHTILGKYWQEKLHKNQFKCFQASERTGFMELELIDDKRMIIKGKAVIVLEGNLNI